MKIILAPDSFKGTLSAFKICELLETAAKSYFPNCTVVHVPMSDGGEGALEVIIPSLDGKFETVSVRNPLGKVINARYGTFGEDSAIIEMAAASGLPLIPEEQRDVLLSNTYGTGELIADALNRGCRNFHIAIGGSATNDGGIGCVRALGVKFHDKNGTLLDPVPQNLIHIADIDISGLHPAVREANFTVMCDVSNPLLGEKGAAYTFGPQKGASGDNLRELETGLAHYADVVKTKFGGTLHETPGAGAAGGLGFALIVFLNAKLQSGIDTILDILDFKNVLRDADFVITGEGRMDNQSAYGKVASGVGLAAKEQNIPCLAIVGSMGQDACDMFNYGISSIMTTVSAPMPVSEALERSEELFVNAAHRMLRFVKAGLDIRMTF